MHLHPLNRLNTAIALSLLLLSACTSPTPAAKPQPTTAKQPQPAPTAQQAPEPQPTQTTDAGTTTPDRFAPRDFSEVMTFEAHLELAPAGPPGSKHAKTMWPWLVRDDGERWLIASDREYTAYDGKRVRVTGRSFKPSPYTAHVGAIHFEVHGIEVVGE